MKSYNSVPSGDETMEVMDHDGENIMVSGDVPGPFGSDLEIVFNY